MEGGEAGGVRDLGQPTQPEREGFGRDQVQHRSGLGPNPTLIGHGCSGLGVHDLGDLPAGVDQTHCGVAGLGQSPCRLHGPPQYGGGGEVFTDPGTGPDDVRHAVLRTLQFIRE